MSHGAHTDKAISGDAPAPLAQSACSAATVKLLEERIMADLDYAAMQIKLRYYDRAWPYLNNAALLKSDLDALRQNDQGEAQPPAK